jgi:hypothetical protein
MTAVHAGTRARAIEAIDAWARSGTRPAPATFPAELGFIPGLVPPAWTAEIGSPSIRQVPLDEGVAESHRNGSGSRGSNEAWFFEPRRKQSTGRRFCRHTLWVAKLEPVPPGRR